MTARVDFVFGDAVAVGVVAHHLDHAIPSSGCLRMSWTVRAVDYQLQYLRAFGRPDLQRVRTLLFAFGF